MKPNYLADTSAWNRSNATAEIRERWSDLVMAGDLALCAPVELELLYSARGRADYVALKDELAGLPELLLAAASVARAVEVQGALASRSQHRGPTPVDLLVAAIAEIHDVTLVHYDRHFEAIARVTGQATEWVAPAGTLN